MDETTSDFTWYNTATTTDENSQWIPTFQYTSWLPYKYEQYNPKWHIEQGYKYQLKHMWD
jgi:hypothetical protein